MTAYVIVGGERKVCRAKDPAHCRYHKNEDGSPMKHYPDRKSADEALEALHAGGATGGSSSLSKEAASRAEAPGAALAIDVTGWRCEPAVGRPADSMLEDVSAERERNVRLRAEAAAVVSRMDGEIAELTAKAEAKVKEADAARKATAAVFEDPEVVALRDRLQGEVDAARERDEKLAPVDRVKSVMALQEGKPAAEAAIHPIDLIGDSRYAAAVLNGERERRDRSAYSYGYTPSEHTPIEKPSVITGVEEYSSSHGDRLKVTYKNVGKTGRLGKARYFTMPAQMASSVTALSGDAAQRLGELQSPEKAAAVASEAGRKAYTEASARRRAADDARQDYMSQVWLLGKDKEDLERALSIADDAGGQLETMARAGAAVPAVLPAVPVDEARAFSTEPGQAASDTAANRLNDKYEKLVGDADWHAYDPESGWASVSTHSDRWYYYADFTGWGSGRAYDHVSDRLVNVKTGESLNAEKDVSLTFKSDRGIDDRLEAAMSDVMSRHPDWDKGKK